MCLILWLNCDPAIDIRVFQEVFYRKYCDLLRLQICECWELAVLLLFQTCGFWVIYCGPRESLIYKEEFWMCISFPHVWYYTYLSMFLYPGKDDWMSSGQVISGIPRWSISLESLLIWFQARIWESDNPVNLCWWHMITPWWRWTSTADPLGFVFFFRHSWPFDPGWLSSFPGYTGLYVEVVLLFPPGNLTQNSYRIAIGGKI